MLPSQYLKQRSEQEKVRRQAETPVEALSRTAEEGADKKLAKTSAPPAASAPAPVQAPANAPFAGALTPALSARTLFYAGDATRQDTGMIAPEKERAMKPLAESAPQANRLERKLDQSPRQGRQLAQRLQLKPLGLRYGFVVRGTDGQDREVDAATASKSTDPVHLTVETNQDAYLQIWKTVGSSTAATSLTRERHRSDLSEDCRRTTTEHSFVHGERARHPHGPSLPSPVRSHHEAGSRHVRPALSGSTPRIHHRKRTDRLAGTSHLHRQPRPSLDCSDLSRDST